MAVHDRDANWEESHAIFQVCDPICDRPDCQPVHDRRARRRVGICCPPAISVGGAPSGVAVDPSTHAVYVTDTGAPSTISVIDPTTTPPSVIPVPIDPSATAYSTYGAAVDPSTHTAYITNGEGLDVINGANPEQPTQTQIDSPQLDAPYGVAVDRGTHVAWVTNLGVGGFSVGSVTPIAGNPPTAEQPISVGDSPDADAVDPANHLVYVANKESNTGSVIDGAAAQPSVIHTIPLPATPATRFLWPSTPPPTPSM